MKQQPQNQALGASETTRFFCTQISPAAGAAGELKQHKKEPNMANKKNTTPGIGETTDSGVMHTSQSSRAHTRTRVVCQTGQTQTGILNNINILANHAQAHTCAREGRRPFTEEEIALWRERIFGEGQEDPVHVAVSEAIDAFGAKKDFGIWAWYANRIVENWSDLNSTFQP